MVYALTRMENVRHKILCDFQIRMDLSIPARNQLVDFAIVADNKFKLKESKKLNKYLDLTREIEKVIEHEGDINTNLSCDPWNNPKVRGEETERTGNLRNN